MAHAGIGVPVEYFSPHRIEEMAGRDGGGAFANRASSLSEGTARRAYMDALLRDRTANGIFASKIQWGQYLAYLDNPEGDWLLSGGHFIHLYREDLLAQAISRHLALETGRWGGDDRVTSRPAAEPRFFDTDLVARYVKGLADASMQWRIFFARNGISPLILTYERLTDDPAGTVRTIVETFGLDVPTSHFDYVDAGPTAARDERVPQREEIRANFLRAHRRVVPAVRPSRRSTA